MKLLLLVALITVTILGLSYHSAFLPSAEAGPASQAAEDSLPNYDIRTDTSPESIATLARLRGSARNGLRRSPAGSDSRFRIEYNDALGVAEVITSRDSNTPLTQAGNISRARVLKSFVTSNRSIFQMSDLGQLHKTADYSNPDGNLSFVRFEQRIREIPVFAAELKAGFTRRNEMFRVINSLAPGIDPANVSSDFGNAETAVIRAADKIGVAVTEKDLKLQDTPRSDQVEFRASVFADKIVAERFYFPVGNGVVRPAWRVLLWTEGPAYYVVVDADGTLLWRKNLTEHQASPATYNVYGNLTSLMKTADSPSPLTPGCLAPTGCAQPPAIARMNFTLIGNESPHTFNNLGWIPDTGLPVRTPANPNITDGNNVEAGIDRDGTQGVDNNGWAFGNPNRVFNYTYNPAPGNPPPGEEPLPPTQTYPPSTFQQGVITHGFYMINRWHDEMYKLGFNEQAGNFQHFNFGRGGSEGDRISFEMQDSSGTNGANFAVTADGLRPRLQMFIWTSTTPDRDGALDSQIVLHEVTHGLTSRLHGNASGLASNMARGMGEGWSDFYAIAMLAGTTDEVLGTHTVAGYISYEIVTGFDSNYYYGFRRFPYAVKTSRGPNGLPHNPLTFRYMNAGCATLIGTTATNPNSAYPRNPVFATNTNCDQIHNLGEIWATVLWELRDQLVQRYGLGEGTRRALQYITDGMKLSPLNPTFIQSRDSILAAVSISDALDLGPVWRGFAIRGMGTGAAVINGGTGSNNTVVTESFDIPVQFHRRLRADFDGDAKSDISVFRPSDRVWYLNRSFSGFAAVEWGLATDDLVPDDYDGDGKTDFAVFRPTSDGVMPDYYILRSTDFAIQYVSWGNAGDIAVTEDFDGDGKSDPAIFRPDAPDSGRFYLRRSSDDSIHITPPIFATVALAGDFDGDGRGDFATYTNGFWNILRSETGYTPGFLIHWGTAGDKVVHADYDGDGKDDLAVYRPSDGTWYIKLSAGGNRVQGFGISTDIPAPADYDGDGKSDVAVYRNGTWYIDRSTSGFLITGFGSPGDNPLPATYLP